MSEKTLIARHAFTVWVGQLAVMAFGVTDTVVAGRYDPTALAALSRVIVTGLSTKMCFLAFAAAMICAA